MHCLGLLALVAAPCGGALVQEASPVGRLEAVHLEGLHEFVKNRPGGG
jgi:hypothetical protein